jgi:hypothetical protein
MPVRLTKDSICPMPSSSRTFWFAASPQMTLAPGISSLSIAQRLVDMGCKLQASTDFIAGGRFGREKKPARALMKAGLYTYFASDAHRPEHYDYFAQVYKKFGDMLREE